MVGVSAGEALLYFGLLQPHVSIQHQHPVPAASSHQLAPNATAACPVCPVCAVDLPFGSLHFGLSLTLTLTLTLTLILILTLAHLDFWELL